MTRAKGWLRWWGLALALLPGGLLPAAESPRRPARGSPSFGILRPPTPAAARDQALNWLKRSGKTDDATQKQFASLWAGDRPLLDKVADTLALGDAGAAKLLAQARNPDAPAPTAVPALLNDT